MDSFGKTGRDTTVYRAALYLRLSKDDEGTVESASITTQRKMLREYARENGFSVYDEYVDDGYSGTSFDRPDFQRMLRDIEQKKVNMVITKDLSRLGRDYILTGQYTEVYFPSKKVRYIAVNDGYDSDSPCTDIAPFKNVINEMYARDISKKIRSAFAAKMQEGAFIGAFPPYGYRRDPQNKNRLVIDEAAAGIVREIFEQAANGLLPVRIADSLNQRGIPSPILYRCSKHPHMNADAFSERKQWTSSGITKMLRNPVYLGVMAQGKTSKVSFRSRATVHNPRDRWYTVEHTHEPLVSREIFELAGKRSHLRRCPPSKGFRNLFSGLAKCADCGKSMSTVGSRRAGAGANLVCGGYKLCGNRACSNHRIDYQALYSVVLASVREAICLSPEEEEALLAAVREQKEQQAVPGIRQREIDLLRKREHELDVLTGRLYEDQIAGILSEERMRRLLRNYEAEAGTIRHSLEQYRRCGLPGSSEPPADNRLRGLLHRMTQPEELTADLLFRLVERIEIGQAYDETAGQGRIRCQTVQIRFRFSGVPMRRTYRM